MANLPTNIGINVKTPTARTAGGVAGDAGKNVTPIHKPLNPNNYTSNPTAGMQKAVGKIQQANDRLAQYAGYPKGEWEAGLDKNPNGKNIITHSPGENVVSGKNKGASRGANSTIKGTTPNEVRRVANRRNEINRVTRPVPASRTKSPTTPKVPVKKSK